jgi:type IV secretory pathway TraG/TraD family ATPase VirD4
MRLYGCIWLAIWGWGFFTYPAGRGFGQCFACGVFAGFAYLPLMVVKRFIRPIRKQAQAAVLSLDLALFNWTPADQFTLRDLHKSVAVFGQTGSGKSSSVLALFARAALKLKGSGGLILASKPEELEDWKRWFTETGRINDLIIFDASGDYKFNCTDFIMKSGGDAREITQHLTTVSEALGSTGKGDDPFWAESQFRLLYNAVVALMMGLGRVTVPELQQFINSAKMGKLDAAGEKVWEQSFHFKVMLEGEKRQKSPRYAFDFQSAAMYWGVEWPGMDSKPKTSILAGVMNILHNLNTGIVRDLISTDTNVTPLDMEKGKWVLLVLPTDEYGQSGKIIYHSWKLLTQKYILRRHATGNDPTIMIIADEAQDVVSSFDHQFLAKCRSHRGCMLYLTQSIHSYMGVAKGHAGEHEAKALMTNFGTEIGVTIGDIETATYLCSLMGERLDTTGSVSPDSVSLSESMQKVLQPINLLTGLRSHGGVVDAFIFRAGIGFSTGENYLKVALEQG